MRRLQNMRVVLLGGLVALASAVGIAEAGWRCCQRQACVVQPVYIIQQAAAAEPPRGNPASHRVHTIIIVDDNDPKTPGWDAAVTADAAQVTFMLNSIPFNQRGTEQIISGREVTREKVLFAIRNSPVGPNDTLFVYYNGHGAQEPTRAESDTESKGHYFDLLRNSSKDPTSFLYRQDVLGEMKRRECLLRVLITDSCFKVAKAEDKGSEISAPTLKFKGVHETEAEQVNAAVIRELFLGFQGLVDINSCKVNEYAAADIFTPIFVNEAKKWTETPGAEVTWAKFFDVIKKKTVETAEPKFTYLAQVEGKTPGENAQSTQTPFAFNDLSNVTPLSATFVADLEKAADAAEATETGRPSSSKFSGDDGVADVPDNDVAVPPAKMPAPAPDSAQAEAPATLRVELPAAAKLFIDEQTTQQASAVRVFETPVLPAGADYEYTLRAELVIDGALTQVTRKIWVRAGEVTPVNLSDPGLFRPVATAATAPAAPAAAPAAPTAVSNAGAGN